MPTASRCGHARRRPAFIVLTRSWDMTSVSPFGSRQNRCDGASCAAGSSGRATPPGERSDQPRMPTSRSSTAWLPAAMPKAAIKENDRKEAAGQRAKRETERLKLLARRADVVGGGKQQSWVSAARQRPCSRGDVLRSPRRQAATEPRIGPGRRVLGRCPRPQKAEAVSRLVAEVLQRGTKDRTGEARRRRAE